MHYSSRHIGGFQSILLGMSLQQSSGDELLALGGTLDNSHLHLTGQRMVLSIVHGVHREAKNFISTNWWEIGSVR